MRRLSLIRLSDERGAVAVVAALLMTVLLGFAAISVDIARLYVERRQLQNGADAAALLVAEDCAKALIPLADARCGAALTRSTPLPGSSIQNIASENANDGSSNAATTSYSLNPAGASSVTIQTSTLQPDGTTKLPFLFAPVLNKPGSNDPNLNSQTVYASSTASWGAPRAAAATLPIAINLCRMLPDVAFNGVAGIASGIASYLPTTLGTPNGLLSLLTKQSGPTVLRYDASANQPLLGTQFLNLTSLLNNPQTLLPTLNTTLSNLLCGAETATSTLTSALPLPTRSANGGFVFLQPDAAPGGNGCQVLIGDLLTNILSKRTNVFADRKLPSACLDSNGNLDSLLNKPFMIPIYALAGKSDDLVTPGNLVPANLLNKLLDGIGNHNPSPTTGLACDLDTLQTSLQTLTNDLSQLAILGPIVGAALQITVNILISTINLIIKSVVPTCTPPQPDWVQIVAFAGFNMTGYSLDVDAGGRTSGGDYSMCGKDPTDPCRGIIGNWTQVVSLNPLNLGPLSVGLTARIGAPTSANLTASLGNTLNFGANAVVLSK